jgi:hypothetical protein
MTDARLAMLREMIFHLEQAGGTVTVVEGKGDAVVEETERALDLEFPPLVRQFYRSFEYLQIGATEFVWIRDMQETVRRNRKRYPWVPHHYLPVLDDGVGGYFYVICQLSGETPDETVGTVVQNPAGINGLFEFVSPNFLDFVVDKVKQELEEL